MCEISSRNSVPPLACSNFPAAWRSAPVKAPFSCPNNSLSRSVSGNAAQLTATNGRSRRPDAAWIARATSSLPVPRSPAIRTGRGITATRATRSSSSRICGDSPTSRPRSRSTSRSR